MKSAFALAFVLSTGCFGGSKSVVFVEQASPNPFRTSGCKLTLDEIAYDKLIFAGQPEGQYVANLSPDQQAHFQDDKKAFSFALKAEMTAARTTLITSGPPSGDDAFLMRTSLLRFTPNGEAELKVEVTDATGARVLDELRVTGKAATLREASAPLGKSLGRYLKSRFTCAR